MKSSPRKFSLTGVVHVIPDVRTFVTPVFVDETGEKCAQQVVDGRIVGFTPIAIEDDFESLVSGLGHFVVGDPAVYGFYMGYLGSRQYLLGTVAALAKRLRNHSVGVGIGRATLAAIERFIFSAPAEDVSDPPGFLLLCQTSHTEVPAADSARAANCGRRTSGFALTDTDIEGAVIKVMGVGGGGGNAVSHMGAVGLEGVDFIYLSTDGEALKHSKIKKTFQIGCSVTKGLGAGADPEVGRQAAIEDRDRIIEMIVGSDMLFIVAGMGGGTGTGAAPVVAEIAKELGILTVAVVTQPFAFEGSKRSAVAEHGIIELGRHVDSLIAIPNQKLLTVLGDDVTLTDAFKAANQVLQDAVQGIADLITRTGMINIDFIDVRTLVAGTGMGMMGSGSARGFNRARNAAEAAVSNPLLEGVNLSDAHGLLVNVTAGPDLRTSEFSTVADTVRQYTSPDGRLGDVVVGCVIDPDMREEIRVTIVATGTDRPAAHFQPTLVEPWRMRMSAVNQFAPRGSRPRPPTLNELQVPTYIRHQRDHREDPQDASLQRLTEGLSPDDPALLDIPAFLRRIKTKD